LSSSKKVAATPNAMFKGLTLTSGFSQGDLSYAAAAVHTAVDET